MTLRPLALPMPPKQRKGCVFKIVRALGRGERGRRLARAAEDDERHAGSRAEGYGMGSNVYHFGLDPVRRSIDLSSCLRENARPVEAEWCLGEKG